MQFTCFVSHSRTSIKMTIYSNNGTLKKLLRQFFINHKVTIDKLEQSSIPREIILIEGSNNKVNDLFIDLLTNVEMQYDQRTNTLNVLDSLINGTSNLVTKPYTIPKEDLVYETDIALSLGTNVRNELLQHTRSLFGTSIIPKDPHILLSSTTDDTISILNYLDSNATYTFTFTNFSCVESILYLHIESREILERQKFWNSKYKSSLIPLVVPIIYIDDYESMREEIESHYANMLGVSYEASNEYFTRYLL